MAKRTGILAVDARPQTLKAMVGRKQVAESVRKYGFKPRAWMFTGPTGTGKTTFARIIAVSLQCEHSKFGNPCRTCRTARREFDITEVNASLFRGVDDIQRITTAAAFVPRPPSLRRVIILDEAQRMSPPAQNLLLKPFEDGTSSTVWIICTTDPRKILPALRNRCVTFKLGNLRATDVRKLVKRTAKKLGVTKGLDKLCGALIASGATGPRSIVQATEQFATHGDAAAAAGQAAVDEDPAEAIRICRGLVSGRWPDVVKALRKLESGQTDTVVRVSMGYLKTMVLGQTPGPKAALAAYAIQRLTRLLFLPDQEKQAALVGVLFELTSRFSGRGWKLPVT